MIGKASTTRAKQLRSNTTEEERWLWTELRGLRHLGVRFRRQVPLGPYIVDFACHRTKTVIELDGNHHATPEQSAKDEKRDSWLSDEGYTVLRYWNAELHKNIDSVVQGILHHALSNEATTPPQTAPRAASSPLKGEQPSQLLPLEGEGGAAAGRVGRGDAIFKPAAGGLLLGTPT